MDSTKPFLLEKDRQEGMIRDNKCRSRHQSIPISKYATDGAIKLSQVVKTLFLKGGGIANYNKEQLTIDVDLSEWRNELAIMALIPEGFDSPVTEQEQINIDIVDNGISTDIRVEVFEND